MRIIALGHRRRMGKDTLATYIGTELERRGIPVLQGSFARKVKDICSDLYGWAGMPSAQACETDPTLRDKPIPFFGGKTVREIWIDFSTRGVRDAVHRDTWVEYLLHQVPDTPGYFIITDLRFPNEFFAIKRRDGVCIKVHRDYVPVFNDPADSALDSTNFSDDNWSMIVRNARIQELDHVARDVMEALNEQ